MSYEQENSDTPQAPYPCVDRCRLIVSDAYRSSYAECRCDDSSHMQSRRHVTLHSYASNRSNARRSRSIPSIIVYILVPYTTYLSLIIFKIIPHPMTLLTAFPLQVIILYLFLYCVFSLTYYRITYPFPCSCKGNLTNLRRELHLSLAKGNPK
jgi:hypothetical protein